MVAKVGLGLVGLSAISVGGVALTNPAWLGMDYMPNFHTLAEDKGFPGSDYETDKFGKKYGRYLVGVNSKNGTSSPEKTNEDWWGWAYRRLSRATTKPKKFEKVEQGYGTEENKYLSQVCKAAYKLADSNGFGSDSKADQFTKADVWKYCSPGELVNVSAKDGYPNSQIGGGSDKATLVSVKNSANDWFWDIRNKDFWSTETNNDWSGQKATSGGSASVFKTAHDSKDTKGKPEIKKLCGDAYEKATSNSSDATDAKRFCALEIPTT